MIMAAGCVAGLLYSLSLNQWHFVAMDQNMMIGPSTEALYLAGAKDTLRIVRYGEWWRLVMPLFLHGGLIHLASNMSILLRYGFAMEKEGAWYRFAPVYILGGLLGSFASAVFIPEILSVGASGACFAIIGAIWADVLQNWGAIVSSAGCGRCSLMFCGLAISTCINLALGLMPFVDNFAHVFGFLGGLFIGSVLMIRPRPGKRGASPSQMVCAWAGGCCYVIFATTLALVLYLDINANEWCTFCHLISCVEIFDLWKCSAEQAPRNFNTTSTRLLQATTDLPM